MFSLFVRSASIASCSGLKALTVALVALEMPPVGRDCGEVFKDERKSYILLFYWAGKPLGDSYSA